MGAVLGISCHSHDAAVGRRTGTEVVLNTSLKGLGEPIAATSADAHQDLGAGANPDPVPAA